MRIAAGIMLIIAGLLSSVAPYSLAQRIAWRLTDSPEAAYSFITAWSGLIVFSSFVILVLTIGGGICALRKKAWGWALAGAICSMIAGSLISGLLALPGLLAAIFLVKRKGEFQVISNESPTQDEHGRTMADYDRAIELDPVNVAAYCELGDAYAEIGIYGQAIADYSKAIELDPGHALAYLNRAYAYGEIGEYSKAITDYSKAIELNPSDAQAYYNRGLDYHNKGEASKAVSDLEKCINLSTDAELIETAQQALYEMKHSP